jgi:membrane fusion protein, multidrug efflux system
MTEHSSEASSNQKPPIETGRAPVVGGLDSADAHAGSGPVPPEGRTSARKRRLLIAGISAVVIAVLVVFGIPTIRLALNTVSTDDAYVNGHLTFVAPRVRGHVVRVLVDDNNRVHKGDILVELDKEPYQNAVAVSKAAVDTAKANLLVATATVRGIEAEARSRRWKLQNAIEAVGNQVALLPGSPPSIRAGPT